MFYSKIITDSVLYLKLKQDCFQKNRMSKRSTFVLLTLIFYFQVRLCKPFLLCKLTAVSVLFCIYYILFIIFIFLF